MFASRAAEQSQARSRTKHWKRTTLLAVGTAVGAVLTTIVPAGPADVRVGAAPGAVTGRVFQDFDSDGVMDTAVTLGTATDIGVAGIVVRAFGSNGAEVASTTTATDGTWSISVTSAPTTDVRVEFSIPSDNPSLAPFEPSFAAVTGASGSGVGTSV